MEALYSIISENPEYSTWAFGMVSTCCLLFAYFNKQSHDKKLIQLKQELSDNADRKSKFYTLKTEQYESYVSELDSFNKKYQIDITKRFEPLVTELLNGNTEENLPSFMTEVIKVLNESREDYSKLKWTSNKFRLAATDEILEILDKLEKSCGESMAEVSDFLKDFIRMNDAEKNVKQKKLQRLGQKTDEYQVKLMKLMREDLR
ncbi:MAG: hypothetical protein KUG78_15030 [Kangiellaceae bacterium]|nr:hypothetical protein [Kangiellaceae bacterium]